MSYSELLKLSFEELYKLYDSSSLEEEKHLIQTVVENKPHPKPDPNFTPYPQQNNPKLQELLFEKKNLILISYFWIAQVQTNAQLNSVLNPTK